MKESSYRAKIILLKDEGYTVPEIRMATNHHDVNIRKWIHRFNEKGIEGIVSRKHTHKPVKITVRDREKDCRNSNQKSKRRLWTTLLNMVFTGTGRIRLQGTKPCRHYKSYSD